MRKLILVCLLLFAAAPIYAQQATQVIGCSSAACSPGGAATGQTVTLLTSGVGYHQLTWTVTGTVSACTVTVDGSANGTSWSTGGAITSQTCTSNGTANTFSGSANVVNYVRTAVSITGSGTVYFRYNGYATNPGGGGSMIYPAAGIAVSTGSAWGTSYAAQGSDTKLLTAGTIAGTGASLCTDAGGGATTSGCSGGSMVYPGAGIPLSTGSAWGTSYTAQGTDTKLLTAGTVSGTSALLCTDANGGATTGSCGGPFATLASPTFNGTVTMPAGSAGTPSLVGTGNTSTGFDWATPGQLNLDLATNGALNLYNNGSKEFSISTPTASTVTISNLATNGTTAIQGSALTGGAANLVYVGLSGNITTTTAGTSDFFGINPAANRSFAPSSGSANLNWLQINPVINQTGTASGNSTGIFENATLTSVLGTFNLMDLQVGSTSFTTVNKNGKVSANGFQSFGTTFTSNAGCSETSLTGGASAGSFLAGATSCTTTITLGNTLTAANGWACSVWDVTTSADTVKQTASTATTVTFSGTVVSGDKIIFSCHGF